MRKTVFSRPFFSPKSTVSLALSVAIAVLLSGAHAVHAEGVYQMGLGQDLLDHEAVQAQNYAPDSVSASIYVDILNIGEVINVSLCGTSNGDGVAVSFYAPSDDLVAVETLSQATSNVDCADPMTAPLTTAFKHTTLETGTYRLELQNTSRTGWPDSRFQRYDVTVTPDVAIDPDPTAAGGRVWGYAFGFNAGGFDEARSTDANYFTMVPGGRPNTHYVWQLDLNNFAGFGYNLMANSLGVDAPNSGYSTPLIGNSVMYQHPMYLSYPEIANPEPVEAPVLSDVRFVDSAGQDYAISPGNTFGVQDEGFFEFTTDVSGTYSVLIDMNRDGVFGNAGDRQLLGLASAGFNQVAWDGNDAAGNPSPLGDYQAQVKVNMGEYHFIANDAETSGGNVDGLTIRQANADGSLLDTLVYWDDVTLLGAGGTSNTPLGALSSTSAGRHTWGNFTADGFGHNRFLDTYVYGLSTTGLAAATVANDDTAQVNYDGTVTADVFSVPGNAFLVSVADADLNENAAVVETVDVDVVNNVTGELETLTLTETGPNTGTFSASMATAAGATADSDNNGTINTQTGHNLTITYIDLIAADFTPQSRTASHAIGLDTDADGIPNVTDLDDDNDGIADAVEGTGDSDGDGVIDSLDFDSDNDGLLDSVEDTSSPVLSGDDVDSDGIDDAVDASITGGNDTNGDGVDDALLPTDTDDDGVADYLDIDSDGDGIADVVEAAGGAVDTDGDGMADHLDIDSDNDAINDDVEDSSSPALSGNDADNDGIDNAIDVDVTGGVDANSNGIDDAAEPTDTDGDGTPNHRDIDADGDGIVDIYETAFDSDGDSTPNYLDLDSDNDSLPDAVEDTRTPALANTDADADGIDDALDVDETGGSDTNGNGIDDALEPVNTDADANPDHLDLDSDSDGISDADEVGPGPDPRDSDADGIPDYIDADSDNDGVSDNVEGNGDSDGDGIVDYLDDDTDNDGILDAVEGTLDTDGDGTPDNRDSDSDNDGIPDAIESGNNPNGIDSDADGVLDFRDVDSDNDGILDAVELAIDTDADGVADYLDLDSDNDGVSDVIESGTNVAADDVQLIGSVGANGLVDAAETAVDSGQMDHDADASADVVVDSDGDQVPDFRDLDSDNDGLADVVEAGSVDADSNGEFDAFVDANNDGLHDALFATPVADEDTDTDGLPDRLDTDSDGDGNMDIVEAGFADTDNNGLVDNFNDNDGDGYDDSLSANAYEETDTDADGIPDYRDEDSDNDGLSDTLEGDVDTDGDGIIDRLDIDSDNDSIPDAIEAGAPAPVDTDGDGLADYRDEDSDNDDLPDSVEAGADGNNPADTDADGIPNFIDQDSDDDGIDDSVETNIDSDGDGVPNALDLDSDNDGITDADEGGSSDQPLPDTDSDGVPDVLDTDADGDGIRDADEGSTDTDGDGIIDAVDFDADNDGIPDEVEGVIDTDGDGVIDALDIDSDNDGLLDIDETAIDSDADGIADYRDLDSDNDGLTDTREAGGVDVNGDGIVDGFVDADGNGWDDAVSLNPLPDEDFDGDGVVDHLDVDSDNDSLTDLAEADAFTADTDGDGRIDGFVDANGDGLDDAYATLPLVAGDLDSDGLPDHLDLDTDNDGLLDLIEAGGADANSDGIVDTMADTDADGVPDVVDVDVTGGADADNDGIDDTADSDFVTGIDTDFDGIVDARDPDINGDGLANVLSDSSQNAAGLTELPDADGDGIPDVDQPAAGASLNGTIQTGLSGSGCSVGINRSGGIDLSLLALVLFSAMSLVRRRTARGRWTAAGQVRVLSDTR